VWLFVLLLVLGAAHWAWIFGVPPRLPRETADWPKEVRYYVVLQQAVTEARLPYYVSRPIQETRKFLAIPETVLSPQIVLLRWLDIDAFLWVNVVLLHAVGTVGCLLLRRRHVLSAPVFLLLWLVVAFGGHIVAHLAIGHSMWGGYFLLPFFCLLALDPPGPSRGRWPIAMGVTLGAMLLQGSFHVFVWCVIFLLLQMAFGPGRAAIGTALAWAGAFGVVRLAPAAAILQGRRDALLQTGYPGLVELLQGLAIVRDAGVPRLGGGSMGGLQWWEFDTYVGPVALVWVLVFGVPALAAADRRWRLAVPIGVMTLLSLDRLYAPVNALGIPLLASQRVTSRFLIVPLLFVAVLAAAASERWRTAGARLRTGVLWLAAAATAVLLAVHSHAWRMERVESLLPKPPHTRDLDITIVPPEMDGPKDALYVAAVRLSALASAAAFGAALWRWRSSPGSYR
jgi:hypothetical protein